MNTPRATFTVAVIFGLALFRPSNAARPFSTDDAGTVEPGSFELEAGADYWRDAAAFSLCMKHGITSRMDLGVSVGRCLLPEEDRGFHGAEVAMKFSLVPDMFSASFAGCFAETAYGVNLIFSKAFGAYTFHANAGYAAVAFTDNFDITYGLANVFEIGRVSAGAEINGTQEAIDWWQAGAAVSIVEWLAIDIGFGGGFVSSESFTATAGLTFALPVSRHDDNGAGAEQR